MQWVIIVINLGVHVLLYAYYGLYELRVSIWWKKVRDSDEQTGGRGEGEARGGQGRGGRAVPWPGARAVANRADTVPQLRRCCLRTHRFCRLVLSI